MGYARADSRCGLRCRTSRRRTHLAIVMLAVHVVTIAFGSSDTFGAFSSDHSRDRRPGSDAGPSDRTVPPAPPPNVRMAVAVPIVDGTCCGLFYLPPGSKEAPPDGQGLQRLPPRFDEGEGGGGFRLEHG